MAIEDIAPSRKQIREWLEEVEAEEELEEARPGKDKGNSKNRGRIKEMQEKRKTRVKGNLDNKFANLPEKERQKIVDDLPSYKQFPSEKRIQREV